VQPQHLAEQGLADPPLHRREQPHDLAQGGWKEGLPARHPEQRAEIVADPSLIPGAVEEVLRLEPPGLSIARYVNRPVEF
jgi:hypothetical protein